MGLLAQLAKSHADTAKVSSSTPHVEVFFFLSLIPFLNRENRRHTF